MNQDQALKQLRDARDARIKANQDYLHALVNCVEQGLTNVSIANALGVSEAAIRMYKKRKRILV